jgi:hypothetical protein
MHQYVHRQCNVTIIEIQYKNILVNSIKFVQVIFGYIVDEEQYEKSRLGINVK